MRKIEDLTTKEIEKKFGKYFKKVRNAAEIPDGVKLTVYVNKKGLVRDIYKRDLGLHVFAVTAWIKHERLEAVTMGQVRREEHYEQNRAQNQV